MSKETLGEWRRWRKWCSTGYNKKYRSQGKKRRKENATPKRNKPANHANLLSHITEFSSRKEQTKATIFLQNPKCIRSIDLAVIDVSINPFLGKRRALCRTVMNCRLLRCIAARATIYVMLSTCSPPTKKTWKLEHIAEYILPVVIMPKSFPIFLVDKSFLANVYKYLIPTNLFPF